MSKSQKIKLAVLELLKDGEIHDLEEMRDRCIREKIIEEKEKDIVRVNVFNLRKEYTNIVALGKGKYKLEKGEEVKEKDTDQELDNALLYIEEKYNELVKFDCINCSDKSLEIARTQALKIRKFLEKMRQI